MVNSIFSSLYEILSAVPAVPSPDHEQVGLLCRLCMCSIVYLKTMYAMLRLSPNLRSGTGSR